MNISESKKAVLSLQYNRMTQRLLDLHEIGKHGPEDREDNVRTMRDVITLIRALKAEAQSLGDILADDGDDLGVPAIYVYHTSLDTSRPYVKFELYGDDDDPEQSVEGIVRKYWVRPYGA